MPLLPVKWLISSWLFRLHWQRPHPDDGQCSWRFVRGGHCRPPVQGRARGAGPIARGGKSQGVFARTVGYRNGGDRIRSRRTTREKSWLINYLVSRCTSVYIAPLQVNEFGHLQRLMVGDCLSWNSSMKWMEGEVVENRWRPRWMMWRRGLRRAVWTQDPSLKERYGAILFKHIAVYVGRKRDAEEEEKQEEIE